ncbi:unnamed protein product, partial [Polarella glacialis]
MHPRNRHKDYLDYKDLAHRQQGLSRFVFTNAWGGSSIDYSDQDALQELTRSLLAEFYNIVGWQIPSGYLCPPVPQRVDYIHVMADLLALPSNDTPGSPRLPVRGPGVLGLDIGTGASCIYCLLGAREYGWSFIASDVDQSALANAAAILAQNGLETQVQLRLQRDPSRILRGVLGREETIAFCVCNPPFHESLQYARRSAGSKWRGLGKEDEQGVEKNYQGQATELCCEGGEVGFVTRMAEESSRPRFRQACIWFSALLSRESSVEPVKQRLGELGARRRVFELCQGRNVKWVIAWTFIDRSVRDVQLRLVTASPGSCAEPSEDGEKRRKKRQIVAAIESPEE